MRITGMLAPKNQMCRRDILKIGILGTGWVGTTVGTKLVELGHDVMMGSRTKDKEKASAWVKASGPKARQGTFADAAKFGEIFFKCTNGTASLEALKLAGGSKYAWQDTYRLDQAM